MELALYQSHQQDLLLHQKIIILDYGYSPSNKLEDPNQILLMSNLMAEVQLISEIYDEFWETDIAVDTLEYEI